MIQKLSELDRSNQWHPRAADGVAKQQYRF